MKAFFIKDFLLIRKWLICTTIMVFSLSAATIIWLHSHESFPIALPFALGFQVAMPIMWASATFRYEEIAKWNILAVSFPTLRRQQVAAKYAVTLVLIGIGGFCDILLLLLTTAFGNGNTFYWLIAYYLIFSALIFMTLALPVLYKFGINGFQILFISLPFFIAFIAFLLSRFSISFPNRQFFENSVLFLPFLLFAAYYVSFKIACKVFKNKEL